MSASELIPQDVSDFLLKTIASVAELEALLLMRREMVSWSAETLAQRLYVPPDEAEHVLRALKSLGFVVQNERDYRYECAAADLDHLVERTSEVYARQLIPVTKLIHDHGRRIRRFADAFRLRRDP
jgi:DNA-binding IclR family transcriptional regulator